MMRVDDYALINNIDMIFEFPLILYGAGKVGCDIAQLFRDLEGVVIKCFCDKDESKKECCVHQVIHISRLQEIANERTCSIVLASEYYYQEMLDELEMRKIKAEYIFTGWGVETAVAINLNKAKIPEEYGKNYRRKIEEELDNNRNLSMRRIPKEVREQKPEILIYQPGKVASVAVKESLKAKEISCLHVHHITDLQDYDRDFYEKYQKEICMNGIKIITMVRDPISRYLSAKMQGRNLIYWVMSEKGKAYGKENMIENIQEDIANKAANYERWYVKELEKFTGIDIFQYPFDKEKGYTIIKKGKIEILVLTMEMIPQNESVIGEFVGISDFVLGKYNSGDSKVCKSVYDIIKRNINISEETLDYYYKENGLVQHCYTKEQIEMFRSKWLK